MQRESIAPARPSLDVYKRQELDISVDFAFLHEAEGVERDHVLLIGGNNDDLHSRVVSGNLALEAEMCIRDRSRTWNSVAWLLRVA